MSLVLVGRRLNKKAACFLVVSCFLTLSVNQCIGTHQQIIEDPLCYSFIVPLLRFDNASLGNQIYCKTRHMINDFLREQIPVYWMSTDLTASVRDITFVEDEKEIFFEKGSFIIQFTGIDSIDGKIIVIICDYNQSSEIEKNIDVKVPVYLLTAQSNIRAYALSEVKIAQYIDFLTCGESWYSLVAYKCGFLDYEFFNNARKKLDNSAYNLLVWPGYDTYYPYSFAVLETIIDLSSGRNTAIRKFVRNGGGFIGSCYAANMAARGIKPFPKYSARKVQNTNSISIGLLSLSDILCGPGNHITNGLEQQISDTNHPIAYGLESHLIGGFLLGGPEIVEVGDDVTVIATFKNDTKLDGTPSIVSNPFGDGQVVLFTPHPEVSDPDIALNLWSKGADESYSAKKLIANAFYYSTAQDEKEQEISESRPFSFISDVWNETLDLSGLLNEQEEVFGEIKNSIYESIESIASLTARAYSIIDLTQQIADESTDPDEVRESLYLAGSKYLVYCFDLLKEYLENTTMILQKIEKIYPLLKDDSNFIGSIENLKNDLSSKSNELEKLLPKCFVKIQKIEDILKNYQEHKAFKNSREKLLKKTSHDIEIQTKFAFQYMPMGLFESLKFLRHYWYDYETSLII